MGQLVSNHSDVLTDLQVFFGENVRVQFQAREELPQAGFMTIRGTPVPAYMGAAQTTIMLTFHINMYDIMIGDRPYAHMEKLEYKINLLLKATNGDFMSRQHYHEAFNHGYVAQYIIKCEEYQDFVSGITKLAREHLDHEFTKALEAKLSED